MRRRIEMGGREIEEGRTRSREELREKRKRSDRPAVEKTPRARVVGYVSILFLVLVLESSQSGVSTRGETLFLLLLSCKRLEGRDDKVPSDC